MKTAHDAQSNSYPILKCGKWKIPFFFIFLLLSSTAVCQLPNLEWAKGADGIDDHSGRSVTTDTNGNVYVIGEFEGTVDFDPGVGVVNLISNGDSDIFIQKLDANGNLIWAKKMGGTSVDFGYSITTDLSGNVYTAGVFTETVDFDPGVGTSNSTSVGNTDAFIQKLDANGNFIWVKTIGSSSVETIYSIGTDSLGNVYSTGSFLGVVDFDPGAATVNLSSSGNRDVFVQKLDANGDFIWAKSMGGTSVDVGEALTVDFAGNVLVTGYFRDVADFDPGAGVANLISNGFGDIFIQKLDANGNFLWSKSMGSGFGDVGYGITTDDSGNVYTTGSFRDSVDFDTGTGVLDIASNGGSDVFIHKVDSDGNFLWAKTIGGVGSDSGNSVATDTDNNVYTMGSFRETVDFDPGMDSMNLTSNGSADIFIQKMDENGDFIWGVNMGGVSNESGICITTNVDGDIYSTGFFGDTVDFDPGVGIIELTTGASRGLFVQKISSEVCQTVFAVDVQVACDAYTWIDGITYTASNSSATYTLMNSVGCDSIVSLDLTINAVSNTGLTVSAATLTADLIPGSGISYDWLDCDDNFSSVGVTTQSFSPTINGNYAVLINENGCSDTSACVSIDNVGVGDKHLDLITVAPNPTDQFVKLTFEGSKANLVILDLKGKLIDELTVSNGQQVDLSRYEDGMYVFVISNDEQRSVERVIKR